MLADKAKIEVVWRKDILIKPLNESHHIRDWTCADEKTILLMTRQVYVNVEATSATYQYPNFPVYHDIKKHFCRVKV